MAIELVHDLEDPSIFISFLLAEMFEFHHKGIRPTNKQHRLCIESADVNNLPLDIVNGLGAIKNNSVGDVQKIHFLDKELTILSSKMVTVDHSGFLIGKRCRDTTF